MKYQIETMPRWAFPTTPSPRSNPFRAKWSDTLQLLERELDYLGVTGAVAMRVVAEDTDVRLDGMLRAHAKVRYRGVVLSFTSTHGPLSYPCDTFAGTYHGDPPDWQINVRAIALALEALRKVDRYGVGSRGEQYAGWRAIEPGPPQAFTTRQDALVWLRTFTGVTELFTDPDRRSALRAAARKAHPDNGGERADWDRYITARDLLQGGVS